MSNLAKLLASDFDRTYYVNSQITKENIQAVRTWRQQGNLFLIATGREEIILREKLEEWGAEADYLICNNGARIVSWDGRVLYEKTMDTAEVLQITDYLLEQYGIPVDVTCKGFRKQVITENEQEDILYHGIGETIMQEEFQRVCRDTLQVHVRFHDSNKTLEAAEQINARYPGAEAFANENNADIVSRGLGKEEGIAILAKAIGFTGSITAIGDSYNDLGMLRRYQGCTLKGANEAIRREIQSSRIFPDVAACLAFLSQN
ncbi:HAD family hydrolase [Candidatus Merdisoma sp. HCP28S3_D10]|uniref:HAD family hydrolase n=1 Tax=unclassified Candidatus Merdisoma TaxID=3099611 RepID=UPI003F8CE25A